MSTPETPTPVQKFYLIAWKDDEGIVHIAPEIFRERLECMNSKVWEQNKHQKKILFLPVNPDSL